MKAYLPLVLLAVALGAVPTPACAPAPMRGEYVEITSETALILWDADTKTEHFIRKANFNSSSTDFGFLVPTPSQPELSEVDDSVFNVLATFTAPKYEYRTVRKPRPKRTNEDMMPASAPRSMAAPRGVEVLEQTEVGGQEAVVLKFHRGAKSDIQEDAKELAEWLKKRGYEFGPQLVNWLKPYIENNWVMTAFRIAKRVPVNADPNGPPPRPAFNEMQGKAVRMSFKTETPFYPYREPEAPQMSPSRPPGWHASGRLLRVFMLASKRSTATLGNGTTPWVANQAWSDKLDESQILNIAVKTKLPVEAFRNVNWLTEYEDTSSPRKGTDEVYFHPQDETVKHRPTIVHEVIEYYDAPETAEDASARAATPYWVVLIAVVGGVAFLSILGVLIFVVLRHR